MASDFAKYFGNVDPAIAILAVAAMGSLALQGLRLEGTFRTMRRGVTARGLAVATAAACGFAVIAIVADCLWRFPEAINVPAPRAFLFYPLMAPVAEFVFHVIPLAILWLALRALPGPADTARRLWLVMIATALFEPAFQLAYAGDAYTPIAIFTGIHVFAISLVQLYLFRRYDFFAALGLRLVYYCWWHIAWGELRLHVLF